MAHDVFLSHSSKDKTAADGICAKLESNGIRCWVAPRDILPGSDWGEAIIEAIKSARVMVLIFSGHANASPQIKREVERAVNKGVPIIPMRIEDVVPNESLEFFISSPHWLDAFTPPLERHTEYLAATIAQILKRPLTDSAALPTAGAAGSAVQETGTRPSTSGDSPGTGDEKAKPGAKGRGGIVLATTVLVVALAVIFYVRHQTNAALQLGEDQRASRQEELTNASIKIQSVEVSMDDSITKMGNDLNALRARIDGANPKDLDNPAFAEDVGRQLKQLEETADGAHAQFVDQFSSLQGTLEGLRTQKTDASVTLLGISLASQQSAEAQALSGLKDRIRNAASNLTDLLEKHKAEAQSQAAASSGSANDNPSAVPTAQTASNGTSDADAVIEASRLSVLPQPIAQVAALYPYSARREGKGGQVIVDFIVDTDGNVRGAFAADSTDHVFDAAAIAAVSQWTFKPGRLHGTVVMTHMQVPVVFSLNTE